MFNNRDRSRVGARRPKGGFDEEWKAKVGPEAWAKLEQYSGKLA